jgi:tungstate transport system substrate-binding protein
MGLTMAWRAVIEKATRGALLALALVGAASPAAAQERFIVLASTTSTEQSGLFAHLLPAFTQRTGIEVRVLALGTGQALDVARRGDADVLLVHDPEAEARFVAEGHGLPRRPVMHNDFVLVGPSADPAHARGRDIEQAMRAIAGSNSVFVSRGDRSGTHAAERRYWAATGIAEPSGKVPGYRECGCGMGPALNMAQASSAYAIADRGTWLSFRNRSGLALLVEGDERMFNPYGVIVVNPARHSTVRASMAQVFADWLVSAEGQQRISRYRIDGQPLFFPNGMGTQGR